MRKLRPRALVALGLAMTGCASAMPPEKLGAHGLLFALQGFFAGNNPQLLPDQPLREPPVLHNMSHAPHTVEVDVTMKQQAVQLLPGPATQMFVFADTSPGSSGVGTFPGPALEANDGDHVIFHIHNQLFQPTTTHFHGLLIPIEQDGAPMNLTPPNQSHTYSWTQKPGFPMTSWYHAHPHGYTHIQVVRGMEAPMRILDPNDPLKAYPQSTLFLSDLKVDATNQLPPDNDHDRVAGREGNVRTVNGQVLPRLTMAPGEIRRLRMGDFATAHFFNLTIPGMTMLQVGTDGGLMEHAVPRDQLLLTVAERAEVLIQAPREPGKRFTLLDLPYDRGFDTKAKQPTPLMTIVVGNGPAVNPPPVPKTLRQIPRLPGGRPRNFELGFPSFGGGVHHFAINGRTFDPLRIDNVAKFQSDETFVIRNKTGNWDHPMHLHSTQFQILDVDGVPPVTGLAWKDVVDVPRNKTARIAVRYFGFTGHYMFHCHILQHENDGLMTTVFVANAPPFQLPPTSHPFDVLLRTKEDQLAAWCGPAAPPVPVPDVLALALPMIRAQETDGMHGGEWPKLE